MSFDFLMRMVFEKFADAFEREMFGLHRYDYRVGGPYRAFTVMSPSEGGASRIQSSEIVFAGHVVEQAAEHLLAFRLLNQLEFGTCKVDARAYQLEDPFDAGRYLSAVYRIFVDKTLIYAALHGARVDSVARSGVGLGVGVDYWRQAVFALHGQRSREVDCGGGFSHATFLVGDLL